MKIAIPSTKPNLDGNVEHRMGIATYLLVIETDDMSFQAMPGPPHSAGTGAGVQAVSMVLGMEAQVVLVGYMAPHISHVLAQQNVEVITHISGSVTDALNDYMVSRSIKTCLAYDESQTGQGAVRNQWVVSLGRGLKQVQTFIPRLVGVILLLGLFRGFVSEQTLLSLFSGSALLDSFWGACLGSVLAGNPVNSYVIGQNLLSAGVGMIGVTALMLSWVNVGIIQLPAESAALGLRFALVRNLVAFVVAIFMSFVLVFMAGGGV